MPSIYTNRGVVVNAKKYETNEDGSLTYMNYEDEAHKAMREELMDRSSALARTLRANGIFRPEDMTLNEEFFRIPRNDPYNYVDGAREYLFFTKPDLVLLRNPTELVDEATSDVYISELFESSGYRASVFDNLCHTHGGDANNPFMRILSNRKTSNFDVPDINVEEMETSINMFGSRIYYPKSSIMSDEDVDFTIEFEDTRFAEIYHLFKLWDYYRQLKWLGLLGPCAHAPKDIGLGNLAQTEYAGYYDYAYYKILHDHISVYKFLVDNDGETILFMAKATGVYPRTISRSSFSEIPANGPLKITVGFKVSGWFEDSTPNIVSDFNAISKPYFDSVGITVSSNNSLSNIAYPWYDDEIDFVSQEGVSMPFIIKDSPGNHGSAPGEPGTRASKFHLYKLLWYKNEQ